MLRLGRRGLLVLFLVLLVLCAGQGDSRPSTLDLTVSPYRYNLVRWEVSNFLDKWIHRLSELMPWTSEASRQERIAQAIVFFDLSQRQRELERQLRSQALGHGDALREGQFEELRGELETVLQERVRIRATVEETVESEVSAVLSQEGFASRVGLIFPPVDTVLSSSPGVLVLSPRYRIERQETILIRPGLSDETRDEIENRIFREQNLSALVESSGGVASYPSVVSDSGGLHQALVTIAHEWLHHWFFIQPLGQHFWDNSQMTTLNETAATLGGRAIGDRAFLAMTGKPVVRECARTPDQGDDTFNFKAAMQETRLRTDDLLAQGKIEEAEAYMENRRQLMTANGHFIRKINQAFFAFHGSYATGVASISPIDEQLRALQNSTNSLGEFIRAVAIYSRHQDLLDDLAELPVHSQEC